MESGEILILGKAIVTFGGLLAFGAWQLYSVRDRSGSRDSEDEHERERP